VRRIIYFEVRSIGKSCQRDNEAKQSPVKRHRVLTSKAFDDLLDECVLSIVVFFFFFVACFEKGFLIFSTFSVQ
jgi:hypothetical protein